MGEVTVEEVREVLPWGVYIDFHEDRYRPLTPSGPFGRALIAEGRADLSPDQIAAAVNKRCGTCGGSGLFPSLKPTYPKEPCPDCRATGSAAPELLELVRRG